MGGGPSKKTLITLGVVVIVASIVGFIVQPSSQQIEDAFAGSGVLGPALFAAAYAGLTVAFVPGVPMTLAAGALYGVAGGFAVSMVGASAGALIAFLLAKRSTGGAIESGVSSERLLAIRRRLEGRGLYALLLLRLLPAVPFNALNYAAGASSIGTRDYAIATVIGIAPGGLAYVALGAGLDDPLSPLFIGAVVLTIALALAARYADKRRPVIESGR
ncbi:TVP38/TMEM64 family protein [soil metagenome]